MHAKSGLRVLLEWKIIRPDSVITDVMPLKMKPVFLNFDDCLLGVSDTVYRTIQRLGAGGNAVTYLMVALDGPNKGVPFAVKLFKNLSAPERRDQFLDEIELLGSLQHPSIMRTYDWGFFTSGAEETKQPYVVAEYLPQTLRSALRSNSLSMTEKLSITLQLLSALAYLSERTPQIVHRDIKPANIFLKGKSCVLGDFGLAKVLDGSAEIDRDIFKESAGVGMPFQYRTPDLVNYANNESDLTIQSDVFQLGLVLAELFTGNNPSKKSKKLLEPVSLNKIGTIRGAGSSDISTLLTRMLEFDPSKRDEIQMFADPFLKIFHDVSQKTMEIEGRIW